MINFALGLLQRPWDQNDLIFQKLFINFLDVLV